MIYGCTDVQTDCLGILEDFAFLWRPPPKKEKDRKKKEEKSRKKEEKKRKEIRAIPVCQDVLQLEIGNGCRPLSLISILVSLTLSVPISGFVSVSILGHPGKCPTKEKMKEEMKMIYTFFL